jgi:O-antigen/teichoic acid export membrane protein/glycosyltransferase involved in cell wall biosynthesis
MSEELIASQNEAGAEGAASLQDAKARIPRNVFFNFAGYAVNILVTFLIAPVVVHRLGETTYGVWGLISEILGYSFLLDFGIRIAVTRYVGRHLALHEPRQINTILTTGLAFTAVSAALALAGGGVVAYFLPQLFAIPPQLAADARLAVLLTAVAFAVSFPGSLFTGCVAALSRYDLLNIRNVGPNVLRGLLLWFFLYRGYGLVAVAAISAATFVLCYVLDLFFASRHLPDFKIGREFLDGATLRTLLNFSFYAFVLTISWRLLFMTDNIVVGFVLGPAAVTYYSVGMNVANLMRTSLGNISNMFAPLASQMDALSHKDSLRSLLIRGSRICLLYALPGVGGLVVLGPSFLGFWMGETFANRSGPVLVVLALEVACFALSSAYGQVLYGMNRHKVNAWLSLAQAATNFALSAILIRWMGAVGVAWGTLIPAVFVEGAILPAYTASVLDVSVARYYLKSVMPPVLAAIPYTLWLLFLRSQGFIRGYPSLALAVCSGLIVYALPAWHFALDGEDRDLVRRSFANVKSAVAVVWPARVGPRTVAVTKDQSPVQTPVAVEVPPTASPTSSGERPAKLHILTVARYPLGGIRTYLKYTYGRFDPAKYRFTIAASRFPEGSLIPHDLSGFEVDLQESDEASGNLGLMRLTHKALRRSHVDLIHSQGLTAGLVAILANWRLRRPHVITPHEVVREDQFPGFWGSLKRRLMAMVLSRADLIVCVTEDARENFRKFLPWFPVKKLVVVPNGIDTLPFAETAERRRQRAAEVRPPDSPFTFAFFGRFMPAKGFDILTDAVAELARSGGPARPFRVLAVNRGDRIGRYKAEVSRRGLDVFFEFPGFTPSVTDVLARVDAVVVPSRWETGPLLPMEAMVAGCPLITSDCIGLREVVRGTPALVASAGDPNSLAKQMKTAMDHEAELRAVFCDFASVARDRFDVRRSAATMEQIFSRLATSKSRDVRHMQTRMVVATKQSRRGREAGDGDL